MLPTRSLFSIFAPLALVAVTACAPASFRANVNRFQAMPAPQGQTFAIVSTDPKMNGSLEFSQYAGLVTQKMTSLGYQPAQSPEAATLVVKLDYGVDQGKERLRSVPMTYDPWYDPIYGGYYSRYGRHHGRYYGGYHRGGWGYAYGFNDPFLFGGYDAVERYTVFTSGLDMKIESRADGKAVFEGKAEAMSLTNNLTYLVPNLVEAMFTGFPGNSGETVRITVAQPKRKK